MSPDWSAEPVPVPYADLTDPQTLNLYNYERGNPMSHADPDGHCPDGICVNIATMSPAAVDRQAQNTTQVLIGEFKGAVNMFTSTVNLVLSGGTQVPGTGIPQLQPSNEAQAVGITAFNGQVIGAGAIEGGVAASEFVAGRIAEAAVPDANIVVRGGAGEMPAPGTTISGSHGATVEEAAQGVPHGQIRTSTAGDVRGAGGSVRSAPEATRSGAINQKHVNIREGTKQPSTFSPPKPNPVPKKDRIT